MRSFKGTAFYWITTVVVAATGLSIGDAIAHAGRLWLSTLLTALAFALVLAAWQAKPVGERRAV